jgi:hypothetical protein
MRNRAFPPRPLCPRCWRAFILLVAIVVQASGAFGQTEPYTPARTPEGAPNLEGIWQPQTSGAAYSILPHPAGFLLGAGSKTGVVEGGVLPYQPWAAELVKYRLEHMELDPTGHCHYEGVPHSMYFAFQIFQGPSDIALVHENMHAWRIIHMDGRHPADYLAWMGDSRGRWEGNTLVVDVANNNDESVFDMAGHFHSDALHVVERFTPTGPDSMLYEATLDDPKVFTRPFKMQFPLRRAAGDYQIMEAGCFEGERDQAHIKEGLAAIPNHYEQKLNTEPGAPGNIDSKPDKK